MTAGECRVELLPALLQHLHAQIGGAETAGNAQQVLGLRGHPAFVGQEGCLARSRQADEKAVGW